MLKAVSGSIVALGTDEIRGVETSHYQATIDVAKLEQLVPAEQRQSLGSLDEAAKAAGLSDHSGRGLDRRRPARAQALDGRRREAAGDEPAVKASLVVELYDYGKPLDIQLPPADEVVDASTLKPS